MLHHNEPIKGSIVLYIPLLWLSLSLLLIPVSCIEVTGMPWNLKKKIKTHAVSLFLSLQTKQDTSVRNHIARRRSMWLWRTQFGHKIPRGYIPVRTLGPVQYTTYMLIFSGNFICISSEIWWLQVQNPSMRAFIPSLCACVLCPGLACKPGCYHVKS